MEDQKTEKTDIYFDFDGVITNRDGQATFNEFGTRGFPPFSLYGMSHQLIKKMVEDKNVAGDCQTMRPDAMEVLLSVMLDPSKRLIILSNNHRVFIVRMLFEALQVQYSQLPTDLVPLAIQLYGQLNARIFHWRTIPPTEEIKPHAPRLSFLNRALLLVDRSSCCVSKVDYMRANSGDRPFILIDDSARNFISNQSRNLNENQYYHVNREDPGFQTRLLADIYGRALEKSQLRESLELLSNFSSLRM